MGGCCPDSILIDLLIDLESNLRVKRITKWRPKRSKIEHINQHKTRRLSRSSWNRLGLLLGHLGVDLGVKNNEIALFLYNGFVAITFLMKISLGRAS